MRLFRFIISAADSEHVPVRVPLVHFANVPPRVRWRPGDFETFPAAMLMNAIEVAQPNVL
jgi:hypothetical protein